MKQSERLIQRLEMNFRERKSKHISKKKNIKKKTLLKAFQMRKLG